MRARHYDPTTGRFFTRDNYEFSQFDTIEHDRYTYARNNPTTYTDPTGCSTAVEYQVQLKTEKKTWPVKACYGLRVGSGFLVVADVAGVSVGNQFILTAIDLIIPDQCQLAPLSATKGLTTVYQSVNAAGKVRYIGITKNLSARAAAHLRQKGIVIDSIKGLKNLTRADARAMEQVLIEQHGLGNLLNKINSIARRNPAYANALRRGAELLKNAGYPGF